MVKAAAKGGLAKKGGKAAVGKESGSGKLAVTGKKAGKKPAPAKKAAAPAKKAAAPAKKAAAPAKKTAPAQKAAVPASAVTAESVHALETRLRADRGAVNSIITLIDACTSAADATARLAAMQARTVYE